MTRTRKFIRGLGAGFATQILIMVGGLWLVRFLLHQLGPEAYGLWLTGAQMLLALGLLDLGIVALLPREVAWTTGRQEGANVPDLVAGTLCIATRQAVVVGLIAAAVWLLLPREWDALRGPLGATLAVFTVLFPLRVLAQTLRGLQDLAFLGALEAAAWLVQAAVLVVLVREGFGLWALAAGWTAHQLTHVGAAAIRLNALVPGAWSGRDPATGNAAWRRERFRRGTWVSVSQVAHMLLAGVDLILIGVVLGPAAVVTYTITAKLALVLANQPQLLLQVAEPGLSELRTAGSPADVDRAARALREAMLLASGVLACIVVGVNAAFVDWWVGPESFGGPALTLAVVLRFLVGHWALTLATPLFAAGYERHLALVGLANGVVSVVGTVVLLHLVGIVGAPLAGIAGILLVAAPANLLALRRVTGVSVGRQVIHLWPVAWRLAVGLAVGGAVYQLGVPSRAFWLAAASIGAALPFTLLGIGRLMRAPTATYLHPRIKYWLARVPGIGPATS